MRARSGTSAASPRGRRPACDNSTDESAPVIDLQHHIRGAVGHRKAVADQPALRSHLRAGLPPQRRHRHRRQEGIDDVVAAKSCCQKSPRHSRRLAGARLMRPSTPAGRPVRIPTRRSRAAAAPAARETARAAAHIEHPLAAVAQPGGEAFHRAAIGQEQRHLAAEAGAIDQQQRTQRQHIGPGRCVDARRQDESRERRHSCSGSHQRSLRSAAASAAPARPA